MEGVEIYNTQTKARDNDEGENNRLCVRIMQSKEIYARWGMPLGIGPILLLRMDSRLLLLLAGGGKLNPGDSAGADMGTFPECEGTI